MNFIKIKCSGQAVLETLVALPLATSCFVLCFLFFHLHAQYLWMDHHLYQSLVCLAKGKNKADCENQMERKIKKFLWAGKLKDIQFHKKGEKQWKGSFTWSAPFWRVRLTETLNLKKEVLL